jgi:hypothetical protein
MRPSVEVELAQRLYAAARLLKIALASPHTRQLIGEAQRVAVAAMMETQACSADGGLSPSQALRLQSLFGTVASLMCASEHPELIGQLVDYAPAQRIVPVAAA